MVNTKKVSPSDPIRVGIIYGPLRDINETAVSYLITHLNRLQSSFEYEILPHYASDLVVAEEMDFMKWLAKSRHYTGDNDEDSFNNKLSEFIDIYRDYLKFNYAEGLKEDVPNHYILITTAWIPGRRYFESSKNLCILSLAAWEKVMAPPSVIESIPTLVMRASAAIACPELERVHLGTKGCIFDYGHWLVDTRYKVLTGIICKYCSTIMANAGQEKMREDILYILREQEWFGTSDNPLSPASIVSKIMGHDLFLTRGLKPGHWETFRENIVKESTKELVRIVATIVIAGILIWVGFQQT